MYYTDRIKETMKVKGWQVSPTELESVLLQHPRIADAAVVGVTRDNKLGIPETFPTAYVVCRGGDAAPLLHGEEVKAFVAARVISYKRITGDVVFVRQIPRSPPGKILRRLLPQAELNLNESTMTTAQKEYSLTKAEQESWPQTIARLLRLLGL
jgi:acyl-coenzyme A synthetase/AMP-(fatty) acid ligase